MTTQSTAGKASFILLLLAFIFLGLAVKATWAQTTAATPAHHYYRVTFDVGGERFRATIVRKEALADVRRLLTRQGPIKFPVGIVALHQNINAPWSWHLRPETITFHEMAAEYCDAQPSYVQNHLAQWLRDVRYYCPWNAVIVFAVDCYNNRCHQLRPR